MPGLITVLVLSVAADMNPAGPAQSSSIVTECFGFKHSGISVEQTTAIRTKISVPDWLEACRQAREADDRRRSVIRALLSTGKSPVGGYEDVEADLKRARETKVPLLTELFHRVARDQAARASLSIWGGNATYAQGLSSNAQQLLDLSISADLRAIDAENTRWLKGVIADRGWFKIGRDGAEADSAAWLIVQHADRDREFQRQTLAILGPLAAAGDTSKRQYAMLYDRWASGVGQPQRFGLLGRCTGPGRWEPFPTSDLADVEGRRREAGLRSLAEQVTSYSQRCR